MQAKCQTRGSTGVHQQCHTYGSCINQDRALQFPNTPVSKSSVVFVFVDEEAEQGCCAQQCRRTATPQRDGWHSRRSRGMSTHIPSSTTAVAISCSAEGDLWILEPAKKREPNPLPTAELFFGGERQKTVDHILRLHISSAWSRATIRYYT